VPNCAKRVPAVSIVSVVPIDEGDLTIGTFGIAGTLEFVGTLGLGG
jgi:hypothetical protein